MCICMNTETFHIFFLLFAHVHVLACFPCTFTLRNPKVSDVADNATKQTDIQTDK